MMRNIRIWVDDSKKCEAFCLEYFLTLCGCQVWKGRMKQCGLLEKDTEGARYLNILIFEDIKIDNCYQIAEKVYGCQLLVSGHIEEKVKRVIDEPWRFFEKVEFKNSETLSFLIEEVLSYVVEDEREYDSALKLWKHFIAADNALTKAIYIVEEVFCSRRIDYTAYKNYGVLTQAIQKIWEWYQTYEESLGERRTFIEKFAVTYLQNLLNQGFIKARQRKGFNTDRLLANANYLWKIKPDVNAALFLQLQIMNNSVLVSDRFNEVVERLLQLPEREYKNRVYCEIGDLFREIATAEAKQKAIYFFAQIDDSDMNCFRGWYKLGLLYEGRELLNPDVFDIIIEQYRKVLRCIETIDASNRTLQEYEYYYKAECKILNLKMKRSSMLREEKEDEKYCQEKRDLRAKSVGEYQSAFLNKMFGDSGELRAAVVAVMQEKMEYLWK